MSNQATPRLRCIFYSHPWTTLTLSGSGLGDFHNEVLVELAQTSLLALTLMPNNAPHRDGLTAALQWLGTKPATKKTIFALFAPKPPDPFYRVAKHLQGLPAPLVYAPNPSASSACQIAGLLSAMALSSQVEGVTALIHYQEAETFSGLFPHVDQFHFLWDIADLPDKKLIDLAQHLTSHRYIATESWGGFHLCDSGNRPLADKVARENQYSAVISQYFQ